MLTLPGFSVAHHRTEAGDCRTTPWWVIRAIEDRYGVLGLDCFAKAATKKAPLFYGPGSDLRDDALDGLPWLDGDGVAFLNPPYSLLDDALEIAVRTGKLRPVVAFVFARTDTKAFHKWAKTCTEVAFLRPRTHCPLEPGTECSADYLAIDHKQMRRYRVEQYKRDKCGKPAGHKGKHGPDNESPQSGHCFLWWDPAEPAPRPPAWLDLSEYRL